MPALPLDDAGPYVAGAYVVFVGLLLVYLAIMASRLSGLARDIEELSAAVDRRDAERAEADAAAERVP